VDVDEELRKTERAGEVVLGSNETLEATESGESDLTVLSSACPRDVEENIRESAAKKEVPLYFYPSGSEELGLALGKPFLVSTLAVIDSGDSRILELGEVSNEG